MRDCSVCPARFAGTLVNMTRKILHYPSLRAFCFDTIIYLGISLAPRLISVLSVADSIATSVAMDEVDSARELLNVHPPSLLPWSSLTDLGLLT